MFDPVIRNLSLHPATIGDLERLAEMNRQLIEDEKSANPMDLEGLRERMWRWLETDYHAVLFRRRDEVIGYALYRFENETYRARRVVYVRQFFVERAYRRKGLGRRAFSQLRGTYFEEAHVRLEVLTANPGGLDFWESLDFEPYAVTMALK